MTAPSREELERRAGAGDEAARLALADALDAEGRHTDAIDMLARAAKSGSAAAKGKVGQRILVGDRAPALPVDGAGLIEEAAREGDPAAAAQLAALAAAGAYRRQSWDEALDWLERAAERGFAPARGQLATLASDPALAAEARETKDAGESDLWARLRRSVDMSARLAAPAAETVNADPLIRRFPGFASPEECDWLVAGAAGRLRRAEVYGAPGETGKVSDTRTNSTHVFGLIDTDVVQIALQARMAAATGVPFSHMEAAAVLHYEVGEEFTDHFDYIDPGVPGYAQHMAQAGQRVMTFLVYLNDDYEGGETEFVRLGIRHRGARGEGLVFANALPSGEGDERTLHAGRSPTRGEKWLASQFIRSKPVVPGAPRS